MAQTKREARIRRKTRIRRKMRGTAERPRLCVFRSARHIHVQVVNDVENQVLVSAGTVGRAKQDTLVGKKKAEKAKLIGTQIAEACKAKGISQVVFDRNGFKYHGRVKALADAARKAGISF